MTVLLLLTIVNCVILVISCIILIDCKLFIKNMNAFKRNQDFINRVREACSWDSYDRIVSLEKQVKDLNYKYIKGLDDEILKTTNDKQFKELHSEKP